MTMPATDLIVRTRPHTPLRQAILGCALISAVGFASAQITGSASAPTVKTSASATIAISGPLWQELSATQKQVLRPLANTWDVLSSAHKSKWIALAQNYGTRSPSEQEKMQSRMVEWAALTPRQRESARLNFAETKKISPSERAAEWEAYQSLSNQEKNSLAAKSKGKPAGAAVAVKPVPSSKLTAVPVTRHTPPNTAAASTAKPRIDPNTLLPLPPVRSVETPTPTPVARPSAPVVQPK